MQLSVFIHHFSETTQEREGGGRRLGLFFRRNMLDDSINGYWILSSREKQNPQIGK